MDQFETAAAGSDPALQGYSSTDAQELGIGKLRTEMITALPLADFKNRHRGKRGTIVGRGPTFYDYEELRHQDGPVFFLNDTVQFERHASGPSYLLAIDNPMVRLLRKNLRSTPVLPREFEQLIAADPEARDIDLSVVFYECDRTPRERLLRLDREDLARLGEIYNGSVTILSALHFLWYCGCVAVDFIGCDGINDQNAMRRLGDEQTGYDRRLANLSQTWPAWIYHQIRDEQDRLCRLLGLETRYLGTPELPHPNPFHRREPLIPTIAHFVWLGGPIPPAMQANIERFRTLHPTWEIRVCSGIPDDLPEELRQWCFDLPNLCMRSDLVRVWLLKTVGGIYVDGDVYPVRPFDELRHFDHFFATEGKTGTNCVMGATAGSAFVEKYLTRVQEICRRPELPSHRARLGPNVVTYLMHCYTGLVNPLPDHYFCLFRDHPFAFELTQKPFPEIHHELVSNEPKYTDGVWPYGIHTYGFPASQSFFRDERSSFISAMNRADALLRRLPGGPVSGAEIGVAEGRMSAYLLGHAPSLSLIMVDRWCSPPAGDSYAQSTDANAWLTPEQFDQARQTAMEATDFASNRRKILHLESMEAARAVADSSLDFVFIDADHSYEAVAADIAAWRSKIHPGGWLCGHDYHGLEGMNWGVERAVNEFAANAGHRVERDQNDTWFIRLP